jgi:formate-dependent nitrite reductase membrane component NrfD
MPQGFNMELRSQQEWSWLLAVDLFLGGLGGGLFLFFEIFHLPPFMALLSLGLVLAGGVVLLMELGHPLRAWRAIFRLRSSWISRGVLFVSLFLVSGSLHIAPAFTNRPWFAWTGNGTGANIITLIAGFCALLITVYPGFVLSASRSIPFWNTPFLPLLFFAHSIMGAGGIVLLITPFAPVGGGLQPLESLVAALIVCNLVLVSLYLFGMDRSGSSAGESVRLLSRNSLGWLFRIGVVLVGMILPLSILLWLPAAVAAAGVCILTGGLLFRFCVLKAGVYVPSALVGKNMSRLNRSDSNFKQEYAGMAAHGPAGEGRQFARRETER